MLTCGKILIDEWDDAKIHHFKGKTDFTLNADLKIEKIIIETLRKHFPDHNILAEESGQKNTGSVYTWIIDPLDGTHNYRSRLPLFNTTIALQHNNDIIFGITYNPATHEFFHANRGGGAYKTMTDPRHRLMNSTQKRIIVSDEKKVKQARFYIEFPRFADAIKKDREIVRIFTPSVHRIRSFGAAALGLAYTAQGSFDGFVDFSGMVNLWDIAAGVLLISEAGGKVTNMRGDAFTPHMQDILATNGHIHHDFLKLFP